MKTNGMQKLASVVLLYTLALVGVGTLAVHAQSTTGSIYGTITDPTGAIIPKAKVTVTNVQTNEVHTMVSNGSGNYVFPSLAPADYIVSAQSDGFKTETQTGIRLDVNQNVQASFTLTVGSKDQTVTVEAATTLVDTLEYQLGSTVDEMRLQELPLNGRDAYDLVQLSPGIANYSQDQNSPYVGDVVGATFSTNGLRAYENSAYLDGANNTSDYRPGLNYAPNPDALQEFRILTGNFDAEFGSMPGAVVNMITRSGTKSFHGAAYEFIRNNIFNTKSYFNSVVTPLKQNQFGGNFGGPILHNKLFFFFSYQGLRIATSTLISAGAAVVPTLAERGGDFSADKTMPKCTGTTSANTTTYPCIVGATPGVIPAQYLDPVVQNMLKSVPLPTSFNGTSGGPTAQQSANGPVTSNQYLGRVDYQLNSKHRLSAMYFHEFGTQASPTSGGQTVLGYAGDLLEDHPTNVIGTDTWIISPNKLNTLRAYYTGNHYESADLFAGTNTLAKLGAAIPDAGSPSTQPNVRIAGYIASFGNSGSAPAIVNMTVLGVGDTFNWTHGNHTLKFGGTLARNKYLSSTVGQRAGIYTVSGFASGNQLADWMLGKSGTYNQNNSYPVNYHQMDPALFAQDDWRISRRLTLNLGLRWEVYPPFHGENNTGTFEPNVQSARILTAPTGVLFNGDAGVPDGVLQTSWTKFTPRVGFAYDAFGNGKTSLRGGMGLFYSQVAAFFYSNLLSPIYNVAVSITNATNFSNPYLNSTTPVDPFPYTPNLTTPAFAAGLVFSGLPPNDKAVPYVMEYNLTVEQQLGTNWAMSISYVGNGSRKFISTRDQNAPVYNPTCTAATCGTAATELTRRPYKPTTTPYVFNVIGEYDPVINSSYNSLQVTLTRRFAHRFSINANYVWSKTMTDGADPTAVALTPPSASNSYNFESDYGKAGQDQPERFVASYLWLSPDIHFWGFVGKEALSGWQLSGITTLSTGQPFNMVSGTDTNYDGVATTDRPNLVGNPFLGAGRTRAQKAAAFFNTAAFAAVPVGTATGLGNTQINMMFGPGRVNTDLAASKFFPIWREHKLQFRADAFNVFANVNLNNPTAQLSSPSDAKITGSSAGRIMQFALKYSF